MDPDALKQWLEQLQAGQASVDEVVAALRKMPFEQAGSDARLDHHRAMRCGFGEVIFCQNKTPDQVLEIFARLAETGMNVLATRASQQAADAVGEAFPRAEYHPQARTLMLRQKPLDPVGHVAVVAAGTSDFPVAEEARLTAELMGACTTCHYDVGVAGLHRLLAEMDDLQQARAIVAVAGMEGAMPSVIGGLVACPVIAIPTSVGYGASFGGVAALLGMLNSCASGVSVVNIDNGFGGGYIAARINRQSVQR
jgi:hypothetical protein